MITFSSELQNWKGKNNILFWIRKSSAIVWNYFLNPEYFEPLSLFISWFIYFFFSFFVLRHFSGIFNWTELIWYSTSKRYVKGQGTAVILRSDPEREVYRYKEWVLQMSNLNICIVGRVNKINKISNHPPLFSQSKHSYTLSNHVKSDLVTF